MRPETYILITASITLAALWLGYIVGANQRSTEFRTMDQTIWGLKRNIDILENERGKL